MNAEKRAGLIGATVQEIARYEADMQRLLSKPGELAETRQLLQDAKDKLRHLQRQEVDYLSNRLESLSLEVNQCSPGDWVELEGLKSEIESKLYRLLKELEG